MNPLYLLLAFAAGVAALAIYNRFRPDKVNKLGRELLEEVAKGKALAIDVRNKIKAEVN